MPRDGFVWADDEAHSPRYWFPRDCPRATWWTDGDPTQGRVHAIEWAWFDRFVAGCSLWACPMPPAPFSPDAGRLVDGVSASTVVPLESAGAGRAIVGAPPGRRHRAAPRRRPAGLVAGRDPNGRGIGFEVASGCATLAR